MNNQEILDNAPEWADTHRKLLSYPDCTTYANNAKDEQVLDRSLADIKRIAELEEERDKLHNQIMVLTHTKEFDYVDDTRFVTNFNNIDIAFQVHSLEQQAKGIEVAVRSNLISYSEPYIVKLMTRAAELRRQAKALKEQD